MTGPGGERAIPVACTACPATSRSDTVLEPGELIVAPEALAPPVMAQRSRYHKVRDRASYAFAVISVAAAVELDGDTVADCRIAFGGLAHVPWRAERRRPRCVAPPPTRTPSAGRRRRAGGRRQPLRDNAFKVPARPQRARRDPGGGVLVSVPVLPRSVGTRSRDSRGARR